MHKNILITQCLQNDFICRLKTSEPLPNLLHIGHREANRLMGIEGSGPVIDFMTWAHGQDQLDIFHIRDWHLPEDNKHLEYFGNHCIAQTKGAEFPFDIPTESSAKIFNAIDLNDFLIEELVFEFDKRKEEKLNIGIIGVWTEAKVKYLCYELKTRYPNFNISVCSALCASSSRNNHFSALNHLEKILGIKVIDSIPDFSNFLGGDYQLNLPQTMHEIQVECKLELNISQSRLLSYLFRGCKKITLTPLAGGFSGNLVARVYATDTNDHQLSPYVLKIGKTNEMASERVAFEKIEEVLGNNAPSIAGFADDGELSAIKYRYASMYGDESKTFQSLYEEQSSNEELLNILDELFGHQLNKFFKAKKVISANLFDYYLFSSQWADSVQAKVQEISGSTAEGGRIELEGETILNIAYFYRHQLDEIKMKGPTQFTTSYIHGDLNGANIIIDGHRNIWLIDFFHTHQGHILKDLVKLENDLLFIFHKVENLSEYQEAKLMLNKILECQDISDPLSHIDENFSQSLNINRCLQFIKKLRSFYKELIDSDRHPLQLWIAQLRYSVHTLGFDECNLWQRKLALYYSSLLGEKIYASIQGMKELRVDFIPTKTVGRIGLTFLPGRKDRGRSLKQDILKLKEYKIDFIICLAEPKELEFHGVSNLIEKYQEEGFDIEHFPVIDQKALGLKETKLLLKKMDKKLKAGKNILIHCIGGIGRSGVLAGCYLIQNGMNSQEAIALIREKRSPRAIENSYQENFLHAFK